MKPPSRTAGGVSQVELKKDDWRNAVFAATNTPVDLLYLQIVTFMGQQFEMFAWANEAMYSRRSK